MNKTVTIIAPDGTTLQISPRTTSNAVTTGGHQLTLGEIDWGSAETVRFRRARAAGDGFFRRGAVRNGRTVVTPIMIDVLKAPVEAIRDDAMALLVRHLSQSGLYTLRQTRLDATGATISRQILGELTAIPAWKAALRSLDDGMVGPAEAGHARITAEWDCPFPWFRDTAVGDSEGPVTLSSSPGTVNLDNGGDHPCGVAGAISGTGAGLTISITNTTVGAAENVVGSGLILTDIDLAGGSISIDWYATDPTSRSITQAGTSLIDHLQAGSNLMLAPGVNELEFAVTAGSISSGQISLSCYRLWSTP